MPNNRAQYEQALNKGHSFSWDQRWEEAIQEFNNALSEFPHEPTPYAGLGMAHLELSQLPKALEYYKLAARYSRGDIIYLRQVADVQERLGQLDEAGRTYMAIGEIELSRKRLSEAMDNWHRAVGLEPGLLRAHQRLASVYQRQGAVRSAIREYLAIARILQGQGAEEKALQACRLALQMDPRNKDVLTAIELIKQGAGVFDADGAAPSLNRTTSDLFLGDDGDEGLPRHEVETAVPVQEARQMALEQLAEKLFDDEETTSNALISQALDFQTRGLTNEAISRYEEAIAAGETSPAAHFNLGLLYQDKMRFEDAIREFEISRQHRHFRLASHFELGESFRARGRIDKAVEHFITVLKIVDLATVEHQQADRLIELYENLADSLITQGEADQATAFANALVEFLSHKGWEDKAKEARGRLDSISSAGMMILGDVLTSGTEQVLESLYLCQEYARRGMYNTAIEETYRAIQLAPDYLPAHIQLADVLAEQGRREAASLKYVTIADAYRARSDTSGAIIAYEKVVDLSPLDLSIRARLIDMLKRHGQIDRSLEHYMAMGDAYYQLARVDQARDTYQEALKLAPRGSAERNWPERLLRAVAEIDMQRFDWRRALGAYRELRRLNLEDERTAITLVDLYFRVGQPNNAVRELDAYLKQLVRQGRGAKVVGILEDMVHQRPSDGNLVNRLCRLYVQQKRNQEAIELLNQLGEAQLEAGDSANAIKTLEIILRLKPANSDNYRQLLAQLRQA